MVYNIYEVINLIICLILVFFVSFKFNLSNKILYLLLLHLLLLFVMDLIFDYMYWPDQFAYYRVATHIRENYEFPDYSNTVVSAGFIFSIFPIFINSVKSIAFINFLLYLFLLIFLLYKIKSNLILVKFKQFYFFYPSFILFTSLGLRDFLIAFCMFYSLYYLIINPNKLKLLGFTIPLFFIKPQNMFLIILTVIFYNILSLKNKNMRFIAFILYLFFVVILIQLNWDIISHLRVSMFVEDTGLSPIYMEPWSIVDIYRILFAPFFFDARNAMQMLQSFENLGLGIIVYKLIKFVRKIGLPMREYATLNFFAGLSTIIYSFVVFNYGTVTRYKFPFVFCWIVVVLVLIDDKIQKQKCFS